MRYTHAGLLVSLAAACSPLSVYAEQADNEVIEEIFVTAVAVGGTKLETSVSVSSLDSEDIFQLAPRSVAEIFRSLPGIRAETSGGNGNANITIRGIPLATGGSKYMQLHEDGLPVLEFGDMNFANTDNFIRNDWSIGRIESIRGGSASTLASNSPGGVINMISKDGSQEGGAIGISFGVDFDEFRTDFDYGGQLADDLTYHVGGFYRDGEGVRDTGFNGDSGGQVKANITKDFDNGFVRVYGKFLDDKVTTYLPSPVLVKSNDSYGKVPGYDASSQTLHSEETARLSSFDQFGNPQERSVSDGIESKVTAFGFEADFDVVDGLNINNKMRKSNITGGFISPFTDGFAGGTDTIANKADALCSSASVGGVAIDCSGGTTSTINGAVADPNQLGYTNLTFDTNFDDVGLFVNDFKISKTFGVATITAGYYYSKQNIDISWDSWHTRMQTVDGKGSQNINIVANGAGIDADGNPVDVVLADNGAVTQSFLAWDWDLEYTTSAPYLNIGFELERFNFDASVRKDNVEARGQRLDGCCGGSQSADLNGNGSVGGFAIDAAGTGFTLLEADALLENVAGTSAGFINGGVRSLNENGSATTRVNYDADNTSFSLGGTFLVNDDMSVFARYSQGGRAIGDRLTQVAGSLTNTGDLTSTTDGYDEVDQFEIGGKMRLDAIDLYATFFSTTVEETNAEVTSGLTFVREYDAIGVEVEADWQPVHWFRLNGNVTWTDAEIKKDATNAAVVGNKPRRQADFIYTLSPQVTFEKFVGGITLQGSSDFYLQDNNDLKQEGYNLVHLFAKYNVTENLNAVLTVNNLTDEFVLTEAEEGSAAVGSFIRGRALSGTSTTLSVRYQF